MGARKGKVIGSADEKLSTGISGLDEVLEGGLISRRSYLVRGGPGSGKTTLGLHFVSNVPPNEVALFIALAEPEAQIRTIGEKLGFDLSRVHILDLGPDPQFFSRVETYDIFAPAEVEREPITQQIVATVDKVKPTRVFIDSLPQFRYLSADAFQYRKQVLSFIRHLLDRGATVLFTSEGSPEAPDDDLQFLCDGIIELRYQDGWRTLEVLNYRGSSFQPGLHSLDLSAEGIRVYPRLRPSIPPEEIAPREVLSIGIPELNEVLGGGIDRNTVTMITGPSGVGKPASACCC